MVETIKGLVLRHTHYREADCIMTLLTAPRGKLTVKARGALRKGSRLGAACQDLCYSEFTLFENRGRWTADEGFTLEQFLGLREDLSQLALGTYIGELLGTVCQEDMPADASLQLGLNALYALSRGLYSPEHVKSVLELRLLCLEGFQPVVESCAVCGQRDMEEPLFFPASGAVCCRACAGVLSGGAAVLDTGSLAAMRHIVGSAPKREFSFVIPEESEKKLAMACEAFVRQQLDKRFDSLDYWKSVR